MPDIIVNTGGTDWLTPAATLLAVIVGGAVSYWVQYALNRRREKGEAKAAARMIQGDLAIAASRMQDMVEKDPTWYGYDDLTLANWDARQGVLALHLDSKTWEVVSQSALELTGLTAGMRKALLPGGPHAGKPTLQLSDNQRTAMRKLWENASDAYNVLAPLAGNKPVQGLLHEGA